METYYNAKAAKITVGIIVILGVIGYLNQPSYETDLERNIELKGVASDMENIDLENPDQINAFFENPESFSPKSETGKVIKKLATDLNVLAKEYDPKVQNFEISDLSNPKDVVQLQADLNKISLIKVNLDEYSSRFTQIFDEYTTNSKKLLLKYEPESLENISKEFNQAKQEFEEYFEAEKKLYNNLIKFYTFIIENQDFEFVDEQIVYEDIVKQNLLIKLATDGLEAFKQFEEAEKNLSEYLDSIDSNDIQSNILRNPNISDFIALVKVKGYFRKNGTYVKPHFRTSPDSSKFNNFSYPKLIKYKY